jgi:hypothetical protein
MLPKYLDSKTVLIYRPHPVYSVSARVRIETRQATCTHIPAPVPIAIIYTIKLIYLLLPLNHLTSLSSV